MTRWLLGIITTLSLRPKRRVYKFYKLECYKIGSGERFLRRKDFPTNRQEKEVRSWKVFKNKSLNGHVQKSDNFTAFTTASLLISPYI